jgi:type II secretory pathway component PulJ
VVTLVDVDELQRRIAALEAENTRLRAYAVAENTELERAESALADSEQRYRTLFNSIDEGFCIIEFLDGPHGPLSDYIHIEANPAYAQHAGIPNVVGQKLREMVPDEADGWAELYGGVLRTGVPIRFERELIATGRYLELAAFRIEPASRRQVAVLFQDITPRKRAEAEARRLNETLEARVAEAIAERKQAEEALRQSQKRSCGSEQRLEIHPLHSVRPLHSHVASIPLESIIEAVAIRGNEADGRRRKMDRQDQRVGTGDGGKELAPRDRRLFRIPVGLGRPFRLAALDHVMHEIAGHHRALAP